MKEIEGSGFPEMGTTEGPVNEEEPAGFFYRISVTDTPIQYVRQIDVQISWDNGKRSLGLVGYVAKQ